MVVTSPYQNNDSRWCESRRGPGTFELMVHDLSRRQRGQGLPDINEKTQQDIMTWAEVLDAAENTVDKAPHKKQRHTLGTAESRASSSPGVLK